MPTTGRDDARERIKKAAPSHSTQSHKAEADRNKKETADLKKTPKEKRK